MVCLKRLPDEAQQLLGVTQGETVAPFLFDDPPAFPIGFGEIAAECVVAVLQLMGDPDSGLFLELFQSRRDRFLDNGPSRRRLRRVGQARHHRLLDGLRIQQIVLDFVAFPYFTAEIQLEFAYSQPFPIPCGVP